MYERPPDTRTDVVREERYVDGAPVRPLTPAEPTFVDPYNYRAVQAAWFVVAVIVTLIAIRFVLKMLGAQQAEFVAFIYGVTAPLVAPFRGIFSDSAQGFNVFEFHRCDHRSLPSTEVTVTNAGFTPVSAV